MRVVLAEDLFLLRDGLSRTLREHGFDVVAAVDNGPSLLHALRHEEPDVAVVDVRLPPSFTDEGLRIALQARRQRPGLPILVLSQYVEQLYANELLASGRGGIGYLLKDRVTNAEQFIDAVRRVAAGGTVLDQHVVVKLLSRGEACGMISSLTSREREVLELMAEGRSNAAVATGLHITESAVAKHIASIFTKLGIAPADDVNRRVLAVLTYLKR
ncbi:response regulator transcription factor [Micromonospora fulviviridis]|uniref:Response regulator transcription factor n=1 Tax=Micromonospora fulviviridis TaxID=47860 RepID=A0ABV2VGY5_9ACTN